MKGFGRPHVRVRVRVYGQAACWDIYIHIHTSTYRQMGRVLGGAGQVPIERLTGAAKAAAHGN